MPPVGVKAQSSPCMNEQRTPWADHDRLRVCVTEAFRNYRLAWADRIITLMRIAESILPAKAVS